ncbi:MAG TPA: hypothetical protein VGR47_05860 [Terracidiphilus sp.]|nr:hypothetical protein [Terracidiphilus sp.]
MQHYTRNTVEAAAWCRKCGRETMHRVDGVKLGPCVVCLAALGQGSDQGSEKAPPAAQQIGLFGGK